MFSVLHAVIAALVFSLVLAGLQRLVGGGNLRPAGPGDEPTIRMTPSDSSLAALFYATATAKLNSLGTAK